jgi:hypothetical protein
VRSLTAIGRLREIAAMEKAEAELDAIARRIASIHPDTSAGYGASLVPLKEALAGRNVLPVALLASLALALLGIVLTNLASLFLARLVSRRREMAVRTSLGARPRDLFSLIFTETLLLTLAGALPDSGSGFSSILPPSSRSWRLRSRRADWAPRLSGAGFCGGNRRILGALRPGDSGASKDDGLHPFA